MSFKCDVFSLDLGCAGPNTASGRLKLQIMLFGAQFGEVRLSYVSWPKVTD